MHDGRDLRVLDWLRAHEQEMTVALDRLVRAESPSLDPAAQEQGLELLARELRRVCYVPRRIRGREDGNHLFARPDRCRAHAGHQLVIGHLDTVWPLGSVKRNPPRIENGRLYGPGSYDMKGGVVQLVFALRALQALRREPPITPAILVTSDEETGSMDSRRYIRMLARGAVRAFVLEPPDGARGELKTGRKGVGRFRVAVHGRAAHAGACPEEGVSAILELSHQIQRLFAMNDGHAGVTVNVGTIQGGLMPNVIAPEASARVDVRAPTPEAAVVIERAIRSLTPVHAHVAITVEGGFSHPPMPQTVRNRKLYRRARELARALGFDIGEAPVVGGASDANLASELTATLDGLGAVGGGAHAADEHVVLEALPERAALLALLLLEP
ncbi:MAG TPA: M20/M25/M40 family metallo-hydrolase [Gaiellaceae bacterium]|nr:M20/M25/M40 family metallo-hydrolase [Gaiellaceae bacterium]